MEEYRAFRRVAGELPGRSQDIQGTAEAGGKAALRTGRRSAETELEKQSRNGDARKEISAVPYTDENSFQQRGVVVQRRNLK